MTAVELMVWLLAHPEALNGMDMTSIEAYTVPEEGVVAVQQSGSITDKEDSQ
jgi:hypothetical protein